MNTAHYRPQITLVIIGNNSRNTHTHTHAQTRGEKVNLNHLKSKLKHRAILLL